MIYCYIPQLKHFFGDISAPNCCVCAHQMITWCSNDCGFDCVKYESYTVVELFHQNSSANSTQTPPSNSSIVILSSGSASCDLSKWAVNLSDDEEASVQQSSEECMENILILAWTLFAVHFYEWPFKMPSWLKNPRNKAEMCVFKFQKALAMFVSSATMVAVKGVFDFVVKESYLKCPVDDGALFLYTLNYMARLNWSMYILYGFFFILREMTKIHWCFCFDKECWLFKLARFNGNVTYFLLQLGWIFVFLALFAIMCGQMLDIGVEFKVLEFSLDPFGILLVMNVALVIEFLMYIVRLVFEIEAWYCVTQKRSIQPGTQSENYNENDENSC